MSPPLRVAHVMHRLSRGGGVQVVVRRLANNVDPSQIDLHVLTVRPRVKDDQLEELPITAHPLGYFGGYRNPLLRLRLMWKVLRTLSRLRPAVVHVHSGTTWLALLHRLTHPKAPYVLEVHDAPGSGRHGTWTDRVDGWWMRRTTTTALVHSTEVRHAVENRWRPASSRVRLIPLGVDTDEFTPSSERRQTTRATRGWDENTTVLVGVGRPAPSKRFDLMIQATGLARRAGADLRLVLVGPGPEDAELCSLARHHDMASQVEMTGPLFGEDLVALLAGADILCSTSEYEGFGLTLIEGMACGLPVVAMAVGGVTDIVVDGETGALVEPGDVGTFARRVCELAEDPVRRREMGRKAAARAAQEFDVATFAERIVALYRELAR